MNSSNIQEKQKAIKILNDQGFIVVPCHNKGDTYVDKDGNIKVRSGKEPKIKSYKSTTKSINIPDDRDCGIMTGEKSNLTVVDIDIKNDGLKTWKKLCDENDFKNDTIYETTPSGGLHYYFKYESKLPLNQGFNGVGIDIRNNNGFIKCAPSIGYEFKQHWDNGFEVCEMPKWLLNWFLKDKKRIKSKQNVNDKSTLLNKKDDNVEYSDPEFVKELVKLIDSKYADDYDDWVKIGKCLKNIIEDDTAGLACFLEFSQLSDKFVMRETIAKWREVGDGSELTIGTIYYYADYKNNKSKINELKRKYGIKVKDDEVMNKMNKFDLDDDYDFCSFKDYLYTNIFNDKAELDKYIIENMYKVCARANDYMITKQPMDEFNNIHSIERFDTKWRSEVKVKYYKDKEIKKDKTTKKELVIEQLGKYLEINPHLFTNLYKKTNNEFIFKNQKLNPNEFYTSEEFSAKYLGDEPLNDIQMNKIKGLLDVFYIVHAHNNKNSYELILDIASFWCVNPNRKSGKCIIFAGKQGTGKSTFVEFFQKFIFGSRNSLSLKGFRQLLAEKNGHLSGKKFVNLNEVRSKKGDYFTNYDDLKTLISDEKIEIRDLFTKTRNEKSSMELIITTNNPNCCPLETEDRKYLVFNINPIYLQKDKEFWTPFYETYFNQECGDILYTYLIHRNMTVTKWHSINFSEFETDLAKDLKLLNKSSLELFIQELQDTIQLLVTEDRERFINNPVVYYKVKNEKDKAIIKINYNLKLKDNAVHINSTSLFEGYKNYCDINNEFAGQKRYFGFDLKNKVGLEKIKDDIMWYKICTI